MKLSRLAFATIAAFLLSACSSKIEGEAFVVTKGGESKKLGLVEVQAYKMSDIDGFKKKILGEYSDFINKISEDHKFVGLKEKYDERKQLISEIKEANKKYQKCTSFYGIQNCAVKIPKDLEDDFERRKQEIAIGTLAIMADKAVRLDEHFDFTFISSRVGEFTKNLEALKTKSDADGKFTMTLPSGEYLIIATGSRESLGEDYLWLLRTDKGGAIRLANDSLFDQGCDMCLFTKADTSLLNEKKKLLDRFIYSGKSNGGMMIHVATEKETGIYDSFWDFMCGNAELGRGEGGRVFEWAECVN